MENNTVASSVVVPETKQFEDVIEALGPPGRYQFLQIFCISTCLLPTVFISIIYVFIGYNPPFACSKINETRFLQYKWHATNETSAYAFTRDECHIQVTANASFPRKDISGTTVDCSHGYAYEGGNDVSMVTEWDLVCDNRGMAELTQTSLTLGWLIGVLLASSIADKYGRKSTIAAAVALCGLFELGVVFAPNIYAVIGLRFFSGMFGSCMDVTVYVLGAEMLVSSYRGAYGMFVGVLWSFYIMLLSGVAYIFRNDGWRNLQTCTSVMCLLPLLLVYFIDESPSWLHSLGNYQEAARIIRKTCRFNGLDFKEIELVLDKVHCCKHKPDESENPDSVAKTFSLLDIFRHRKLRSYLLIAWICYLTCELTVFGLYFSASTIVGNLYFNMFLMSLLELPGSILNTVILKYKGRCFVIKVFTGVAGICLLSSACLLVASGSHTEYTSTLSTVFFFMGKFSISFSYNTLAMYTPEIFPTTHRSLCLGVCVTGSCLGGMMAPYLLPLFKIAVWAPGILLCVLCLSTVLLMFKLPETKGEQLSSTIEEFSNEIDGYVPAPTVEKPSLNGHNVI